MSDPNHAEGASADLLRSILFCRCPRCGNGRLFRGSVTLALAPACSACGLDYRFADPGDGPAVFAILFLGALVLGAAMVAEFRYDAPLWLHILLWGVTTPLLALGLLRWLKAGLVALQWKHKAGEGRTS
ncbi:MAG TPA: DUF983 domain-containing protein [Hyphomicrobiaceae bacterium]|nr:DUF983 domain-containing protein [Hyphomicrobiaceae bacterium]